MIEKQPDFGTPAPAHQTVALGKPLTLTVDGREVTVAPGTSVMRAAALAGIKVPRLCATDSLDAFGSCRVCLVEIEGRKGYPASCTTLVEDGMEVRTESEHLTMLRRNVVELYVSDHAMDGGPTSVDCELQTMAKDLGISESRYSINGSIHTRDHQDAPIDDSNPYFSFDATKCIVCYRCVRACDDIQGTYALTVDGRGFDSRIIAGQDDGFMESDCVSCGACVDACPTEALQENSILEMGMPERHVITTCAYCGVGCAFRAELKADEEGEEAVVRMTPWKEGKANEGHACIKGRFAWGYATHEDRILEPMIRDSIDQPWKEVSWDEAIAFAAKRLKDIQAEYGPGSIGGITSSRCTN